MAIGIKEKTLIALEEEVTEGTYVAPSAGASFISPMADGMELNPVKEILDRGNLNASLDDPASRTGIKSVNGSIPVEFKSGDSLAVPEYGPLVECAMGSTDAGVGAAASGAGNSASSIKFADTSAYSAGDIVQINESGGYWVSPISSVVTDTSIELLVAGAGAPADNVTVTKLVDYRTADQGHPSLSISKFVTGSDVDYVRDAAAGCKVTSMALSQWVTGQMPMLTFGFEGLSNVRSTTAPGYTPAYDASQPVIALQACIYKDGTALGVNEFSINLENTLGFQTTTCSENGRVASRITNRTITGTILPYKEDDAFAQYTDWLDDTEFSLFGYAYNPTSTSGEFDEVVAVYCEKCQFTEISEADTDGLLQEPLTFKVNAGTNNTMVIAYG